MSDLPFDLEPEPRISLITLSCSFSNKVKLISLLCFLKESFWTQKQVNMSFESILNKIQENIGENTKRSIIDICDAFYTPGDSYNNYDLKSASQIKEEINKILDSELPF